MSLLLRLLILHAGVYGLLGNTPCGGVWFRHRAEMSVIAECERLISGKDVAQLRAVVAKLNVCGILFATSGHIQEE